MNGTEAHTSEMTLEESGFVYSGHVCKCGHREYSAALQHPVLMMLFEAVEEEIEFSQIERLS